MGTGMRLVLVLFITALDWGPMTFVSDDSGQVTDMMIGHPGQQTPHR